jgi:hypothetical protein
MKSESDKILSMLEQGTITAAEAEELLDALEEDTDGVEVTHIVGPRPTSKEVRSAWRLPFNISLVVMTVSGSLLWRTRGSSGFFSFLKRLILLPITFVAGLSALILYLSKNGPWLYLRFRSVEGNKFAFSLPFPLNWARRGLRAAQEQVDDPEVQGKLDAVADFLEAVETSNLEDPVSINVREDGESVEIYLI